MEREKAMERAERRARIFRRLFLCALTAAAALGVLCWRLNARRQTAEHRETVLSIQLDAARSEAERLQTSLDDSVSALDEAEETIGRLEQNALLTQDGTAPEYTQLYPEMVAEPWTGEAADEEKVVYLTFDDGPSANTERVLEILAEYGVQATFFVVGRTGEADQARMRAIVAAGHTLGVHSWTHDYRTIYASVEAYLEDFHQLYDWIYEVTGTRPWAFRFPGGSINAYNGGIYQEIISEMTRRGFVYFDWNASVEDATSTPRDAASLADCALRAVGKNRIVLLCHDSAARGTTVEALPDIIEGYQAAGYTFRALTPGVRPVIMNYIDNGGLS